MSQPALRQFPGVMISSTFTDLKEHRAALIKAIHGQEFFGVVMENDSAKPDGDVIDSSLQMVGKASAYILVIGRKYGQTPKDLKRNPRELSITELEFDKAQDLKLPTLVFIMGENHWLHMADVEPDAGKKAKLDTFRERAKQDRVYATFDSLEDFTVKAIHAVANLRRHLDKQPTPSTQPPTDPIPAPPAFYAEPPYIGSHQFVGRQAQLDVLSDWAAPSDQHPVLLFDAIGGSGKSMLTWEWTTKHATEIRKDWAGRFWYSFYERGAIMADFCRHALAYITREPLDTFRKVKTPELAERLLHHLRDRSWLLILDGLERVLVAYNRIDAAELPDEEASQPTDQIAHRDPCTAIRPEDDDLLRALAAAAPSKVLITSRLVPRVMLNPSQTIPGVLRVSLPGLRPADAEELLKSCGVTGRSEAIQNYLKSHCDCHPLVTGVLAGIINDYLPDRGNFDAWAADPASGGQLNLADLDLVQKRNHILKAALDAVPVEGRQLLSILALLSEAVDYPTLTALAASPELAKTVRDLERRGLLQYDSHTKRYDLHPVIRGIAAGRLRPEERDGYGQRVVDHFSARAHSPYDKAETLDDVRDGIHVVRTLLKMGRYRQANEAYLGDLSNALLFNLEAHAEVLSLLRPFFPWGWAAVPKEVDERRGSYLASNVAAALNRVDQLSESSAAYGAALAVGLRLAEWPDVTTQLRNVSVNLRAQNRLAPEDRCLRSTLNLATLSGDQPAIFRARLDRFEQLAIIGQWPDAQAVWDLLDPMGRNWPRNLYRPGGAECDYARVRFWQGDLHEEHLTHAEQLARAGKNRFAIRYLHRLRGAWRLERTEWALAAESLGEAVSMARAVRETDPAAETQLALAQFQLGYLADPRREAEQLANAKWVSSLDLADLWCAIGDRERAKKHALAAYKFAWADGEPYVSRHELNKSRALLEKLGAEIPNLPPYDPAKDEEFPCEDDVAAAIEKLRAEKEAKKRKTKRP